MTTTIPSSASAIVAPTRSLRSLLPGLSHGVALTLTGLFAGFFLTYTMSVVRGLGVTDDVTYVTAFQGINDTIRNLEFAIVFFGTLPAVLLAVAANRGGAQPGQLLRFVAAALVAATIAITFAGNVPLNRELADVQSLDATIAAEARASFESMWNRLNLARTVTAVLAFVALASARR